MEGASWQPVDGVIPKRDNAMGQRRFAMHRFRYHFRKVVRWFENPPLLLNLLFALFYLSFSVVFLLAAIGAQTEDAGLVAVLIIVALFCIWYIGYTMKEYLLNKGVFQLLVVVRTITWHFNRPGRG